MPLSPKERAGTIPATNWPERINHSALFHGTGDCLTRTPGAAGDRTAWTFHCWLKPGDDATSRTVFQAWIGNDFDHIYINGGMLVAYGHYGGFAWQKNLPGAFADKTAWYDLVLAYDSANAVAEDRVRVYVNGVRRTAFSVSTDPAQGLASMANGVGDHGIGGPMSNPMDGYLAAVHFIDGQALGPESFGALSARVDALWTPRTYGGAYGGNGFRLDFADAADLGADASGNGNDWTVIGAPAQTLDTPTNNHCTLNPHATAATAVSGGSLVGTGATNTNYSESWPFTFILGAGKWWFRTRLTRTGNAAPNFSLYALSEYWDNHGGGYTSSTFHFLYTTEYRLLGVWHDRLNQSPNIDSGSLVDILLDFDSGTFTAFDDTVPIGTIDISSILGTGPFILDWTDLRGVATGYTAVELDFGATGTAPPAGYEDFLPICAANLPDGQADVLSGSYLGNGSADGPFVWSNCALASVTIGTTTYANDGTDGAVRFHSNGFKLASATTGNTQGVAYPWTATKKSISKYSNAQEG